MTSKTYYVSAQGFVKRLDNLTGAWNNVSVPLIFPTYAGTLLDVETDPNDISKVFVVGEPSAGIPGIFVSANGGSTWTQPGGTLATQLPIFYEISVVNSNVAYACGAAGKVVKTLDGGTTFNFLTDIPPASTYTSPVISTKTATSLHFITPSTGVVGTLDRVWKTTNGGNTWSELTAGSLPIAVSGSNPGTIVGIHISANQQTIILVGQFSSTFNGGVFVSTDGGVTYTKPVSFVGEGTHLTWINDNELWAFGSNEQCYKTSDGGITWLQVTPYNANPTAYTTRGAHFYSSTNGFFGKSSQQGQELAITTDTGITGTTSDTGTLVRAVWTGYVTECRQLWSCEDPSIRFYIQDTLFTDEQEGLVIKLCPEDLPQDIPTSPIGGTPMLQDESNTCGDTFALTNCCDPTDVVLCRNAVLSLYVGMSIIVPSINPRNCYTVSTSYPTPAPLCGEPGSLINLTGGVFFTGNINETSCDVCTALNLCKYNNIPVLTECTCFRIESPIACPENSINITYNGQIYDSCLECSQVCYLLTNCVDNSTIVVTDDLSPFVDLVIEIPGCPGQCWFVTESPTCEGAVTLDPGSINVLNNCDPCLPPPPEPKPLKVRQVVPGYTAKVCSVEYVEKVNCKLADLFYNETKKLRYGIQTCCEGDLQKWKIKKKLLDFATINTPNPIKQCFCYIIEWISGTTEFKYIDCNGVCQNVTSNSSNTTLYICSQNYPRLACTTGAIGQYSIVGGEDVCTNNESCVPAFACTCYAFVSLENETITYTDCVTGIITTTAFASGIVSTICAITGSISNPSKPGFAFAEVGNCSGGDKCTLPSCGCYGLSNNSGVTISYEYTDCEGNLVSASLPTRSATQFCSVTVPEIAALSSNNIVLTYNGDCSNCQ